MAINTPPNPNAPTNAAAPATKPQDPVEIEQMAQAAREKPLATLDPEEFLKQVSLIMGQIEAGRSRDALLVSKSILLGCLAIAKAFKGK